MLKSKYIFLSDKEADDCDDGVFLDLRPSPLLPIRPTNIVVFTAVVGPMHCRSDGQVKNIILVHPTYFKLSLGQVSRSDGPFS